jgi:hypothetical protein
MRRRKEGDVRRVPRAHRKAYRVSGGPKRLASAENRAAGICICCVLLFPFFPGNVYWYWQEGMLVWVWVSDSVWVQEGIEKKPVKHQALGTSTRHCHCQANEALPK